MQAKCIQLLYSRKNQDQSTGKYCRWNKKIFGKVSRF